MNQVIGQTRPSVIVGGGEGRAKCKDNSIKNDGHGPLLYIVNSLLQMFFEKRLVPLNNGTNVGQYLNY